MSAYIYIAYNILRINTRWPWPRRARALVYETDEILLGGWQLWSTCSAYKSLLPTGSSILSLFVSSTFNSDLPSSSPLWTIKLNYASEWRASALGRHVHQWLRLLRFQIRHQACRPRMKRPADMLTIGKWRVEKTADTRRVYTINPSNRSCSLDEIAKRYNRYPPRGIHLPIEKQQTNKLNAERCSLYQD